MAEGTVRNSSASGTSAEPAAIFDPVAAARALTPMVAAAAGELERTGRLPAGLLEKMHDARLFRLLLPRSVGGLEVTPVAFVETVEALAQSDASTAWLVAQGCGCTLAAIYLAPATAAEVFGPHDAILAWGPGVSGARAVQVPGGYRVTGRWDFASGNRNARWLGGHCVVHGADGQPVRGPDDKPIDRTMLFRRENAVVEDTWQVIGLAGTGSDSYRVTDLFVPVERTFTREAENEKRETGAVYQFTAMNIFAFGVAGIALGVARAMLRALVEIAGTKVERATGTPLRDSGRVQAQLAMAEARLASSRCYMLDTARELYATAQSGARFTLEQRARMRLSTVWASTEARAVAEFAWHAAGSNAIFANGPLERRMRDIHTVSQQVQAHESNFELVGQALLGVPVKSRLL